jgi:hypothetical protein
MPFAILGTGRSGTSMVARMLNLCRLYMGEQEGLWDARYSLSMNPTGFWEQAEIHELMDRLFHHFSGTWESPPMLPDGWEYSAEIEPFYCEAKEMVARIFKGHDCWAWKLPMATPIIAFWQRVIPNLKFIVCVRNPLDFAQSLGQHASVSRSHLFAMWQYYNYYILTASRPEDRIVTFYEDYFPCYQAGLAPVLDFVGLPHPASGDHTDQSITRFYDPNLKHYTSALEDVLIDDEVPYVTRQLYLELLSSDAHDQNLPILSYREMLLPLLKQALIGEGVLDGSAAVSKAHYQKLKGEVAALEIALTQAKKKRRIHFFSNFRKLT